MLRLSRPAALTAAFLLASAATAAAQENVVTNPDWLKRPDADDLGRVWPARSAKEGVGGQAMVQCSIAVTGYLHDCSVVKEDPPDYGFGPAALALTPKFQMKPGTVNGRPAAGGTVRIPIRFDLGGGGGTGPKAKFPSDRRPLTGRPVTQVLRPVWFEAPSRAEVAAATASSGLAVLACRFTAEARLKECKVERESPGGAGLGAAALKLAPRFKGVETVDGASVADAMVSVPLYFDPYKDAYIVNPAWKTLPSPLAVEQALKPAAAAAPDRTARGAIDCAIARGGLLSDCRVTAESAPGAGAAVAGLAKDFSVSPWTDEGRATVGARIRIPLKYVDDAPATDAALDPDPAAAAAAAAAAYVEPEWAARPSGTDMADALDSSRLKGDISATVLLDCAMQPNGHVTECRVESEGPPGLGFGEAALRMAPKFRMRPDPSLKGKRVKIPIRWQING